MNDSFLIFILLLSVLVFAYFSSVEIVFLSTDKLRMWHCKKNLWFQAYLSKLYAARGNDFFSTVLLGQHLALLVYALVFSLLFQLYLGTWFHLLDPTVLSKGGLLALEILASILLFAVLAELFRLLFRPRFSFLSPLRTLPLLIVYPLFYPMVVLCKGFAHIVFPLFVGSRADADRSAIEKSDLFYLSEDITEKLKDVEYEKDIKIFKNALDFSEVKLHECMVPRNEIFSIAETATLSELQSLFVQSGYSRILVYRETRDNMIGYVSSKDLFKDYEDLRSMLRPIDFVPETMPAQKQLASFIKNKKSVAIVIDEFGGTAGLVTLEDVMEEIFGDIEDEHDSDNLIEKRLSDDEFLFSGRLEVDYLNDQYGLSIPEKEGYETLAGYIIYMYERLPTAGEELLLDHFIVTVVKLSATRIELVKLRKLVSSD